MDELEISVTAGPAHARVALVSPQPVVARILELTGADRVIPVYDTLQDAQTAD